MQGAIVQVNVSAGGVPKHPVSGRLITSLGLDGDAHAHPAIHGGPRQAILLIASETIDQLRQQGYPIFYGALGENLTTRGIDMRNLRMGDRIRAGGALLEITKPRVPCRTLDVYGETLGSEIYDQRVSALEAGSPRWGMSGFYCSVVEPGMAGPGDIIAVVAQLA